MNTPQSKPTIREFLEEAVDEMVLKGIYWPEAVTEFEKLFITRVLDAAHGNLSLAAERMGVHRNTLSKKMKQYNIPKGKR